MTSGHIVLITKDRPATLVKTLAQLEKTDINTVIIDDSTSTETGSIILDKYKNQNIVYHGKNEQNALLKKFKGLGFENFIRPLASKERNLGFLRNYALIVSKSIANNGSKILFMDDDIIIREPEQIYQIFCQVGAFDFVGAKITGMVDDSIVGHLMRACGGALYEFLAGGFLAFDINAVSEYFLDCYNEDQIWLFLHSPETRFKTFGEVEQQEYDTFENAISKALNQEFGEIIQEGSEEAFRRSNHGLLLKEDFWKEICEARVDYLDQLPKIAISTNLENVGLSVYRDLKEYHSKISHGAFVNVFQGYFESRDRWRTAFGSI
jgi:glycosyltransferase involved in cell wall biosynthesis